MPDRVSVTQGAHRQWLLGAPRTHPGSGMWRAGRLDHSRGPRRKAERGELLLGTLERPRVSGLPGRCALLPQQAALGVAGACGPGPPHTGICGGCMLSESGWKLSKQTPCWRQSKGPLGEIRELSGKGWGLCVSTAQAVSAPATLPVPWSSLRRMGSLSSPDGLCEQQMQRPGGSVAGWSDTWVMGPNWSLVPVPPLLGDPLASSALDIDSRCLLVF